MTRRQCREGPQVQRGHGSSISQELQKKVFHNHLLSGVDGSAMSQLPIRAQPPRRRLRMILSAGDPAIALLVIGRWPLARSAGPLEGGAYRVKGGWEFAAMSILQPILTKAGGSCMVASNRTPSF